MMTRMLILFTLVFTSVIFVTGARIGSLAKSAEEPETAFVAQDVPLDADIIGSGIDAEQLLQKSLEKFGPAKTTWLKTSIRQTMNDGDSTFVAEGFLQRGPKHCARLEMDIVRAGKKGRFIVVSDGEVVAEVRELPGEQASVAVAKFPSPMDETSDEETARKEKFLRGKSCGGPLPILEQIHKYLRNARLRTGLMHDVPMIHIKGEIDPDAPNICPGSKSAICQAGVYLDAKTLWPHRVEWWGVDKAGSPLLLLCVEFLDPQINRELSVAECERAFSYRPIEEIEP